MFIWGELQLDDEYISVTQINNDIDKYLKANKSFKKVHVKGEVFDVYLSKRGHYYFYLKDDCSSIKCIVYYRVRKTLKFKIENGMQLLVIGSVNIYNGRIQINVNKLTEDGLGQMLVALEQLKEKLSGEGLFDLKFKKEMPLLPKKVGVVTSHNGAALKDIIKIINQNNYDCEIFIFPSLVQGKGSVEEIACQIERADNYGLDLLIVGRGGGSVEDLWSFNDEKIARQVFKSNTPIISAVGHQRDSTLIDYVSDIAALTPTDAANKVVNQFRNFERIIEDYNQRLINFSNQHLLENKNSLNMILSKSYFSNPALVYESQSVDFDSLFYRFNHSSNDLIGLKRNSLEKIKSEYVIRYPCKMQFDSASSNLNALQNRLIDAVDKIFEKTKHDVDSSINDFNFITQKILQTQNHRLDKIKKSYFIKNPCINQLKNSKMLLKANHNKSLTAINLLYENNRRDYESIKNKFIDKSNELIKINSYRLNLVKSNPTLKNHLKKDLNNYNQNLNNLNASLIKNMNNQLHNKKALLDKHVNNKLIKNPDLILNDYRLMLKSYEEKLDKINQRIELESENKKQKSKYMIIIALVIVIFISIIVLLLFGGI